MQLDKKFVADDGSLLARVFSLASQKAQTLDSLSSLMELSVEDLSIYWFMVNKLRRHQGHTLPAPGGAMLVEEDRDAWYSSGDWYAPTWLLNKLLEEFHLNESLVVHYEHILSEPEGGHYELNLAASEIVQAVQLENADIDTVRLKRVCVQACEPTNGLELLVSRAGKILLDIETYREKSITPLFIEHLYTTLTKGISIKEEHKTENQGKYTVNHMRDGVLESFCNHIQAGERSCAGAEYEGVEPGNYGEGNPTVINALIALYFFKTFRIFSIGNNVIAYLMYFIILHRAGYHFSAHVPVAGLLSLSDERADQRECCSAELKPLAVECDGYYDWTGCFERAVSLLVDEQRRIIAKLNGMSRRRERLRVILDADETLNHRQRDVLLEAVLHSNAEFTYGIHVQRYDVSYPCARSDYGRLLDIGFLRQHDDGIRHFFVASDNLYPRFLEYLKEHCSQAFFLYYHKNGSLRDEFKGVKEVVFEYNRCVGFYEKSLLDKTYIEHYDFRRTPIADHDGPRIHGQPKDKT